jgi:hypothetical protein
VFITLLWRIVRHQLGLHLFIPLAVTVAVWVGSGWNHSKKWYDPLFENPYERAAELVAIYASFLIVIALSVRRASDVRTANLGVLQDALKGSSEYFAIGTIPLREWFDPNTLVYLATIVNYQKNTPGFEHKRVLLFYTESRLKALKASYLDRDYAEAFAAIHERFGIPLLYLGPEHMQELVKSLDESTRDALGWYRWFARPRVRRFIPAKWQLRRGPRAVPFAVLRVNQQHCVLQFSKHGHTLTLRLLKDHRKADACAAFVEGIRSTVYLPDGGGARNEFVLRDLLSV